MRAYSSPIFVPTCSGEFSPFVRRATHQASSARATMLGSNWASFASLIRE